MKRFSFCYFAWLIMGLASFPLSGCSRGDSSSGVFQAEEATSTDADTRMEAAGVVGGCPATDTVIPSATGPNYYVRAGATGNGSGSDWNNAFTQLPATLVRNATYYVADGTYSSYSFKTPVNSTQYIVVKKATVADHGTATGWSDSYGDGSATFGPINMATSYIVFNGVSGADRSGHGFKVYSATGGVKLVNFAASLSNIYVAHTEIYTPSKTLDPYVDAVYGPSADSNIVFSYDYIHDISRAPFLWIGWKNVVIEHSVIARNRSTSTTHSEGISTRGGGNFLIRHNVWEDIQGTAVIVNLSGSSSDWEVYGNVFLNRDSTVSFAHGVLSDNSPTGQSTLNSPSPVTGLKFYNNTMYNLRGYSTGLSFWSPGTANIVAYNNIWYNSQNVGFINVQHDYNAYLDTSFYAGDSTFSGVYSKQPGAHDKIGTGNPFVDLTTGNFGLRAATTAGLGLSAPYNVDPNCRIRGADGLWDRGAYEYLSGTTASPAPVPSPSRAPSPLPSAIVSPKPTVTVSPRPSTSPVATVTPSPVPTTSVTGLVAAYGFNEGSGTTLRDLSGRGNNGTVSGATWNTTGRFSGSLSFNGTASSMVTINDSAALDLTTGMTLEAWVNPTSVSGWRSILFKESSGAAAYYLYANSQYSKPTMGIYTSTTAENMLYGGNALPLNTWTHLAATYDGATERLYVNGVQVASRAQTGSILTSAGALRIGGNSVWGEYFSGRIDEVRIYNRALSAAQIQSDMSSAIMVVTPLPSPTATTSPRPSTAPSPVVSPKPSATVSPAPSPKPSASPSPKPSASPSVRPSPTVTPAPSPSVKPSPVPTASPAPVNGSVHYIRAGSNGNGSDWANALPSLPSALERGDTYYIASGSYAGYSFDDPTSGSEYITIKKATVVDHGTSYGWSDSYGTGSARFSSLSFGSNYYIVDGGKRDSLTTGYGITVLASGGTAVEIGGRQYLTLRNMEITFTDLNVHATGISGTTGAPSNITLQNMYIHDLFGCPIYIIGSSNVLLEGSVIARNKSTADWHSEGIQARGVNNMTVRYNRFLGIQGTAVIVSGSGTSGNRQIYGNIFDNAGRGVGNGIIADNFSGSISNVYVYNNVFTNFSGGNGAIAFYASGSNRVVQNNIWYNVDWIPFSGVSKDYNYYSASHFPFAFTPAAHESPVTTVSDGKNSSATASPFVNAAGGDFHLKAALSGFNGNPLASPYNRDPDGNTRGADGVFDRGAFEFKGP